MENKDQEIIEQWLRHCHPGKPLMEVIKSKGTIETIPTGRYYVVKSKWKIVNWWRKLTGTEKIEEKYKYKWIV